jgi:hypothetical protein
VFRICRLSDSPQNCASLQVRLYDLASGELAGCGVDPHAAPVSLLHARPGPSSAATLLLSSSRQVPLGRIACFLGRGRRQSGFARGRSCLHCNPTAVGCLSILIRPDMLSGIGSNALQLNCMLTAAGCQAVGRNGPVQAARADAH